MQSLTFIQNKPLAQNCVIPAKAGIQQKQTPREADKIAMLSRFHGRFLTNWIPTFAGMTANGLSGFIAHANKSR
ncbi:MAG: hypothetical protein ITD49_02250 [Candidatus Nitrotoga sp.]|nr:hypothetical protein [Candidatus Nitrotoga sp.]